MTPQKKKKKKKVQYFSNSNNASKLIMNQRVRTFIVYYNSLQRQVNFCLPFEMN